MKQMTSPIRRINAISGELMGFAALYPSYGPAAQQAQGFVGKVPETFPSSVVPTDGKNPYPLLRDVDSEAKILNNVAAQLGDNTSVSGTINLLTERAPCASCSNVIQQFQAKCPNITVNVMENGGVISPTKKVP